MIDHLDVPAERELPEPVRAVAQRRVLAGARGNPGRSGRTMAPFVVSAAMIAMAVIAVGITALGGGGANVPAGSQYLAAGSAYLPAEPSREIPPEDTDAEYHVQFGMAPADLAGRCLAEADRAPEGRPAPRQWQLLLAATNHDDTVIAYHTPAGAVFCEVTATTVALSQPGAATATAQPTFITSLGTVAGTIAPGYRAAWVDQWLDGQPYAVDRDYYQGAVVEDGIFLLPDAIPVPRNGLELGVSSTAAAADMRTVTIAQDQLPAVVHPRTDNAGALPPADQQTAAGQRTTACLRGPNSIPVVAQQSWIPGAYLRFDGHESVQLASLGANHDLLGICTQRTGEPIDLEVFDQDGCYNVNTIDLNQLITATDVAYDFQPYAGGGLASEHAAVVGQVLSPAVGSIRMTWPGGPNLSATIQAGTYVLPGYDANDPSLHGTLPTITVYDSHGIALRSFPVKE